MSDFHMYLGAVVAVKDDRYSVVLGHEPDVLGTSYSPQDGRLLPGVLDSLSGEEGSSSVRKLQ